LGNSIYSHKISYSRQNGISVTASAGITTPIGRFSIDYTQDLSKRRASSNVVYVDRIKIQKQDLVVVIRDRNKNVDNLYKIENGATLDVTTTGKTHIQVIGGDKNTVIVDITDVDDCVITFNRDNKTHSPDRTRITNTISNYYENLKNNQFENLRQMFAYQVQRFYDLNNVDRNIVVERIERYDKTFGIYGKYFSVRWNTLEVYEVGGFFSISYLLDYSIDRYNKTKPSKFLIEKHIKLNQNYQIVSIYETT